MVNVGVPSPALDTIQNVSPSNTADPVPKPSTSTNPHCEDQDDDLVEFERLIDDTALASSGVSSALATSGQIEQYEHPQAATDGDNAELKQVLSLSQECLLDDPLATVSYASVEPDSRTAEARERKRQARKRARQAAARRKRVNASVYVMGLPDDANVTQVAEHFSKCGILLPDPRTGRPRVKLYTDEQGKCKGDALISYAFEASVENALVLLDGAPFRPGITLRVQRASFDHKPSCATLDLELERPAKRPTIRAHDLVQDALAWDEEPRRRRGLSPIVALRNVFDIDQSPDFSVIHDDMVEGCSEFGNVQNVTVFEHNRDGAVVVRFDTMDSCYACIDVMNGRWYDGRQLSAELYDGTDFRHEETEHERQERDKSWEQWLGGEEDSAPNATTNGANGDELDREAAGRGETGHESGRTDAF